MLSKLKWINYKTVTTFVLLIFLGILQACGPLSKPVEERSCNFVQNSNSQRISWKGSLPIPLHVHESFPVEYLPALEEAVLIWENSVGRRLFEIVDTRAVGPNSPRQDNKSTIYWMKNWEVNKANEQGRTTIHWLGNAIHEADIRINARDFTYYIEKPNKTSDVHLTSLIVHELGHVLGLRHEDANPSVMATYLSVQTVRKDLSQTDLSDIRCEY